MIQAIKEKFASIISSFRTRGASEQMALVITVLSFILVVVVIIGVINFILPKTRVEISVSRPETAKAGEEVSYTVTIRNTGTVVLKDPELFFNYPPLSLPETTLHERITLEDLYPEQEKKLTFNAKLFGREGEVRKFEVWLNYSTERQPSVRTSKVAQFSTVISEVPIDLILDLPGKAPAYPKNRSEFILRIRYFSFIDETVANLKLLVDFPAAFTFKESIPLTDKGREFEISSLEPLSDGSVEIVGTLPAGYKIGEELEFTAQLFVNLHGTDVLLKKDSAKTVTYEPVFAFSQKINNQERYFPYLGEKLYYEIYFRNIQDTPLRDLSLNTILDSPLFDLESIEAPSAKFTKGTNYISWDGTNIPELRYLTPGQEEKVEFWITLKENYKPKDITETNALISNRVVLSDFEKEFRSRVNSFIKISQEGYFRDKYGFFNNSGPQPPRAAETTQYTIVWKIENYYNWLDDVTVKASIPSGVYVRSIKPVQGEIEVTTYPTPEITPYPDIPADFRFEKPLYEGMRAIEVTYLQLILKKEVPRLYPARVPATGYFGPVTREAVKGFQEKYRKEILDPQGLPATGLVDESTRLKLNELLVKIAPPAFAEATWKIGKIKPGTGILEEPLTAAFQIAFTPSMAQRGKVVNLINEVRLSAKDQWTDFLLFSSDQAIDTSLPHDNTVKDGKIR